MTDVIQAWSALQSTMRPPGLSDPGTEVSYGSVNSDADPRVTERPVRLVIEADSWGEHQPRLQPELQQNDPEGPVVLSTEAASTSEGDLGSLPGV